MDDRLLVITADTNDADFVTDVSEISDADYEKILPMIEAIRDFTPYSVTIDGELWTHTNNYPNGEYWPRTDLGEKTVGELYPQISPDIIELFESFVPCGTYGICTITSIYTVDNKQILL